MDGSGAGHDHIAVSDKVILTKAVELQRKWDAFGPGINGDYLPVERVPDGGIRWPLGRSTIDREHPRQESVY